MGALMFRYLIIFLLGIFSASFNSLNAFGQSCGATPVAVQILGSGGPRMNPTRASSSYLFWLDGHARILIDMGGGAQHRFGESRAKLEDLWMVGISHLHPDHVSDLPAFLWLSHEVRKEPLKIFGPTGNDAAPDFATFLNRLFDEKTGAFPVLGSALGGSHGGGGVRPDIGRVVAGGVRLEVGVIDVANAGTVHRLSARGNDGDGTENSTWKYANLGLPCADRKRFGRVQLRPEWNRSEVHRVRKRRKPANHASRNRARC